MASTENCYDVVIIGAGISGINAAYRLQSSLPAYTYTILESRGGIGGTWDFWKYPGIRSDSDMHTFGFPWRPWTEQKAIGDGPSIKRYICDTAAMYGIDKKVQYYHKVTAADWSSDTQRWNLPVLVNGEKQTQYSARFILLCSGYYNYNEPLPTNIAGLENFNGTIVHPQFWPEKLDYANKKIAIIGSGATAVTLLPNLAEQAERVTMVQRSPGYLISLPSSSGSDQSLIRRILPAWFIQKLVRVQFLLVPWLFFLFCRKYPNAARRVMRKRTEPQLPENIPHDPHFHPRYNPWEQRLCACPNGDFFAALRSGRAGVATGQIQNMTEREIVMEGGERIEADIIVTATGLKMQMAGGIAPSVDGQTMRIPDKFLWKGIMLQDLPNCLFVIGYTNASWTLGADAAAQHFVRLLKHMQSRGKGVVVPRVTNPEELREKPVMNLNSTYIQRAKDQLPKVSDSAPWLPRQNYFADLIEAKIGDVSAGLEFVDRHNEEEPDQTVVDEKIQNEVEATAKPAEDGSLKAASILDHPASG
ncbi:MAG: hypothetical protein Q9159_001648 [Coniocarpon cinnabarinum]